MDKIYVNDPIVPYRRTKLTAQETREDIEALFDQWGITQYVWVWYEEIGFVAVTFAIEESWRGKDVVSKHTIPAPQLWRHLNHGDVVDLNVSLRVLYWYLKSRIEHAYLTQTPISFELLQYTNMLTVNRKVVKLPQLGETRE